MASVHKTVLVPYSDIQMFKLVEQVELYPDFLPWCGGADVKERNNHSLTATLHIHYHGIKQSFTTQNTNQSPHKMQMNLLDGPFKHFQGEWEFTPLDEQACKVQFHLQYEFSSKLLEMVVGPVFNKITNSFVDAFIERAEHVYTHSI